MKKIIKAKNFILGFVSCALIVALAMSVFAALPPTTKKNVDVYYGYNVYVDGVKFEPTDKNGVIEPFNYGGWIYAPFEHIAKALGKEAYWDSETRSLYLGKRTPELPDSAVKPESSVKMYDEFPYVPDFGLYFGIKLVRYRAGEGNSGMYIYDVMDMESGMITKYSALLMNLGFVYFDSQVRNGMTFITYRYVAPDGKTVVLVVTGIIGDQWTITIASD